MSKSHVSSTFYLIAKLKEKVESIWEVLPSSGSYGTSPEWIGEKKNQRNSASAKCRRFRFRQETAYLTEPDKTGSATVPKVAKVAVAGQKEVGWDQDTDVHVERQHLAGAGEMVDEDHQLHPTLPLVRLVTVKQFSRPALVVEEQAQHQHVADGQPKAGRREEFIFLHEDVCSEKLEQDRFQKDPTSVSSVISSSN